ncbi:MAG: DeoR family transcriptional regulator [Candidatus Nealsonbacteria bacterium]
MDIQKNDIIGLTNKLYRLTLLFPKKEPLRYKTREISSNILTDLIIFEVCSDYNKDKDNDKKDLVFKIRKNLEVINSYFQVIKWQNWVSFFDILEIEAEYDKIHNKLINFVEIEEKLKENKEEEEKEIIETIEEIEEIEEIESKSISVVYEAENFFNKEKLNNQGREDDKEKEKNIPKEIDDRKSKILKILGENGKMQVGQISEIFPNVSKRTIRRDFVQLLEQGLIKRIGEKNDTFYQLIQ